MPKLPDFTDLNGVAPQAARSFVQIPGADFSGTRAFAEGIGQVGQSISNIQEEQRKKAQAQERFNTKMGLLKAEEAYADRVKDLDPLDPQYVEKKKQFRKETVGPVLQGVQDPENRQLFEATTYEDFVNIGVNAEKEQREAFGKKAVIDVGTYADGLRKKARTPGYAGDAREELRQTINDNQFLDSLQKEALFQKLSADLDADAVEGEFDSLTTSGVALTPDVQKAIAAVDATPGAPSWMSGYLSRLATVESGGGRNVINPDNPDVAGVWQFSSATGKEFGLNSAEDRLDVGKSTAAVVQLTARNFATLKEALGRDPTPGELYLAHQQGAGGAIKLLTSPEAKAADVVGRSAVELNLPESVRAQAGKISAAEFAGLWTGKFERKSGIIDQNEVLSVLEQSPAFMRMSPDAQDKVKADLATRIDAKNKEAAKDITLNTARSAADYAVNSFKTLDEGAAWIKQNVADPDAREKALTMQKADWETKLKNDEAVYKDTLGAATVDVVNAVNQGDIGAAFKAIPAGLEGKDVLMLQKIIEDGPVKFDDTNVLDEINYLKYGTDEERRQFANMDLRAYMGKLKPSTYEALFKEQQAIKKQVDETGSAPSLAEPAKMLNDRLLEIGIDTSAKVSSSTRMANLAAERKIKTILDANLKLATDRAGRKLQPDEIQRVMDDTFLEFSRKEKNTGWTGPDTLDVRRGLPEVMAEFTTAEEALKMPAGSLFQQAMDYHAQEYQAAKQFIDAELRALPARERDPSWNMRFNPERERARLLQAQRALEETKVDAQYLFNWLEDFKKGNP